MPGPLPAQQLHIGCSLCPNTFPPGMSLTSLHSLGFCSNNTFSGGHHPGNTSPDHCLCPLVCFILLPHTIITIYSHLPAQQQRLQEGRLVPPAKALDEATGAHRRSASLWLCSPPGSQWRCLWQLVLCILPLAWQTAGPRHHPPLTARASSWTTAKTLERWAVSGPGPSLSALELAGSGKQDPGLAGAWQGAPCQGARPCQPPSPKQQPIVPAAPKSPEDLPVATVSRGRLLSKGPAVWLLPATTGPGGPCLAGGPGTSGPAGNSQPELGGEQARTDPEGPCPLGICMQVQAPNMSWNPSPENKTLRESGLRRQTAGAEGNSRRGLLCVHYVSLWGCLQMGTHATLPTGKFWDHHISERGVGHREGKPLAQKWRVSVRPQPARLSPPPPWPPTSEAGP